MTGMRRAIVGVVGGDKQMAASYVLGQQIAQQGWILLTGGRVLSRAEVEVKGEAKNASMLGADEAARQVARLIGILSDREFPGARWDHSQGSRRLFLFTGLPHNVRNVINGRTPDVVVAFGGSCGTLAEIAFARASARPLLFSKGSLDRLRRNFQSHFASARGMSEARRRYFAEPLAAYEKTFGKTDTPSLLVVLEETLATARETDNLAEALGTLIGCDWRDEETLFPGLPGDNASKVQFESIVRAISK